MQGWEGPRPPQELAELLENGNPWWWWWWRQSESRGVCSEGLKRAGWRWQPSSPCPYVSTLVLASRDEGHLGTCGCAGTKGAPGVEKPFHVRQAPEARERKAGGGHRKD